MAHQSAETSQRITFFAASQQTRLETTVSLGLGRVPPCSYVLKATFVWVEDRHIYFEETPDEADKIHLDETASPFDSDVATSFHHAPLEPQGSSS